MTTLLGAAILISGVGIGFGSAMAYLGGAKDAQVDADKPQQQPKKVAIDIVGRMKPKYGLDSGQETRIKEIMAGHIKSLHDIRKNAMDEMVAIHAKIATDMQSVMTPEQFARWKKHNEEIRKRSRFRHHRPWGRGGDRSGNGRHGGWPGGGGFDFFKRLDKNGDNVLSEDEIKKVPEKMRPFWRKADKNGDGKIERKEVEAMFRRRRPSSSPRGPKRGPRDRSEPKRGPKPSTLPGTDLSMFQL